MPKINPFKPNSPIPTSMFAGRYDELVLLEKGLFQTKGNQPCNYLITGDRGIGKSSLLLYLKYVATGSIESISCGKFNFISIPVQISEKTDIPTLIKLIERGINRELSSIEAMRSFLSSTWEFVQRLKIMDSGITPEERDSEVELQLDSFAYSLAQTCKRITNLERNEERRDGILLVFDECDNASENLRLGYFFKSLTELLQNHECTNIMFAIAGLPDVTEKLSKSHASSLRVFHQIKIKELSPHDRYRVIERGIEEGNRINQEETSISTDAKSQISVLSEGYPHFIQQFAYSAFDVNTDGEISTEDVTAAAFKVGGAIDAIGSRYYQSDFYDRIKSDEYREVLKIMADNLNSWTTKAEIRGKFSGDENSLTNALQALTSRKIILKNPAKMGEYRLQQRGFAIWIKLFGNRPNSKEKS